MYYPYPNKQVKPSCKKLLPIHAIDRPDSTRRDEKRLSNPLSAGVRFYDIGASSELTTFPSESTKVRFDVGKICVVAFQVEMGRPQRCTLAVRNNHLSWLQSNDQRHYHRTSCNEGSRVERLSRWTILGFDVGRDFSHCRLFS